MISNVHLRHFKCFENLDLPLGRITLLTGKNATGKSTLIQSLLLLHQNLHGDSNCDLCLNGDSVSLGAFGDVLDSRSGRKGFSIGFTSSDNRIDWQFESNDRTSLTAPLIAVGHPPDGMITAEKPISLLSPITDERLSKNKGNSELMAQLAMLLHVSTERIGPRETYQADPEGEIRLGPQGEYTAWFLHRNGEQKVADGLLLEGTPPTLLRQAEAWLSIFFPGSSFQVSRIADTNLVTLRFRTSKEDSYHRAENVGYGLSHLLPVLVGGLGAGSEKILIIENPEAHLHPSAQADVAHFLVKVAACGAQVILESHSDHVLNGIRRAVKEELLSPDEVKIHYFNSRDTTPQIISPILNDEGALDQWPSGFFDQYVKDLDELTTL